MIARVTATLNHFAGLPDELAAVAGENRSPPDPAAWPYDCLSECL